MTTLIYLIFVGIGVVLSYPLTIIIIAYQQAVDNAEKIRKYLTENK